MNQPSITLLTLFEIVLGIIVTAYGIVLGWTISRVLGLEKKVDKEVSGINKELAVLKTQQDALRESVEKFEERNEVSHERIIDKIDDHHKTVMAEVREISRRVKNGSK